MIKNFLTIAEISRKDIRDILSLAERLKKGLIKIKKVLKEKNIVIFFQKPSLRTRISLECAIDKLGGNSIFLTDNEVGLGKREIAKDVILDLNRFVDGIIARVYNHKDLEQMVRYAEIPVINALSDLEHPLQALADLLTIKEKKGKLKGLNLGFIGYGDNVPISLLFASIKFGINFSIASSPNYSIPLSIQEKARIQASQTKAKILFLSEPDLVARNADILYTQQFVPMGKEKEANKIRKAFKKFSVTKELLKLAKRDVIFMHCLPAYRGEEVTNDIIDSQLSIVFDQAENRLWTTIALFIKIYGT
ncbi:ornithine carbamoyltransferase [Patescibacteria group bacterium]|nr:ornithine carbamoyltransferase [Patescibacteria group bacterium]MBU4481167.1 ornithine carbamoyltransferase [Patescibacteria group bacterium]